MRKPESEFMTKKCLAVFLSIILVILVFPAGAFTLPAGAETSKKCGENLTWEFDDDRTLIISGTGSMWQYFRDDVDCSRAPWRGSSCKKIHINSGVTSIGSWAFYECHNLTSITIPDSVTSIGEYAFYECTNLTSLIIPDSVTEIGNGFLLGCTGLTSISISNSLTRISVGAFDGCRGLTSINIPGSVTEIENDAFSGCTNLTTVYYQGTVPEQWEEITIGLANDPLKSADIVHVHTFSDGWQTTTASSCVSNGLERRVCTVCGEAEERIIPAHHTEQLIRTVSPTCTNGGYDLVRCIVCGTRYQTNPTAALGHDYQFTGTVAATCVKAGYHRYTCTRCGEEERTAIPAVGHYFLDGFCVDCGVDEQIAPYDLNGDTDLNALDMVVLRIGLLKNDTESPCDFNNDGVSDIRDMVRMKKMLATVLS